MPKAIITENVPPLRRDVTSRVLSILPGDVLIHRVCTLLAVESSRPRRHNYVGEVERASPPFVNNRRQFVFKWKW